MSRKKEVIRSLKFLLFSISAGVIIFSEEIVAILFQRGASSKGKGRGTGLVLVREVAEAYHGEIRVESESGVGTSFFLSFCREEPPKSKE